MDDRFVSDHAPGSMVPTASAAPCLFVPRERLPAWMPSALAYALHLRGEVPFAELDTAVLKRGRWLEHAGRAAIQDEFGLVPMKVDLRREALSIPLRCWLDDVVTDDTSVEYKSVSERDFAEHWADGPPDYPVAQASVQMTIEPKLKRVLLVPVIFGYAGLRVERFEVERDQAVCDMIADTVAAFVALLRRGEVPEHDGSESSYRAWSQRYAPAEAVLDLSDDAECKWRAEQWFQARLDRADVEAACEAHKWFFSRVLDRAGDGYSRIRIASLPEDIKLSRTEKKGYTVAPSSSLSWRFVKREK